MNSESIFFFAKVMTIIPYFVWLAVAIAIVQQLRKEPEKRGMQLIPISSPENDQLAKMVAAGTLSAEEAAKIQAGNIPLPQAVERHPYPDRVLLLVRSISQVIAVCGIAMTILGVVLVVWSAAMLSIAWWAYGLVAFWGILGIAYYFLLYKTAAKVLQGSIKARNLLVGMWIVNIALGIGMMPLAGISGAILNFFCGGFCVWGAFLRRGAAAAIETDRSDSAMSKKILILSLFILAVIGNVVFIPNIKFFPNYSITTNTCNSTFIRPAATDHIAAVEKIILVETDSDTFTQQLTERLKQEITKTLNLPCESYQAPTPELDVADAMVFFIKRSHPAHAFPRMPDGIFPLEFEDNDMVHYSISSFPYWINNSHACLERITSLSITVAGKNVFSDMQSLSGELAEKAAASMRDFWNNTYKDAQLLPATPSLHQELPPPEWVAKAYPDAELLYQGNCSSGWERIYRFPIIDSEQAVEKFDAMMKTEGLSGLTRQWNNQTINVYLQTDETSQENIVPNSYAYLFCKQYFRFADCRDHAFRYYGSDPATALRTGFFRYGTPSQMAELMTKAYSVDWTDRDLRELFFCMSILLEKDRSAVDPNGAAKFIKQAIYSEKAVSSIDNEFCTPEFLGVPAIQEMLGNRLIRMNADTKEFELVIPETGGCVFEVSMPDASLPSCYFILFRSGNSIGVRNVGMWKQINANELFSVSFSLRDGRWNRVENNLEEECLKLTFQWDGKNESVNVSGSWGQ